MSMFKGSGGITRDRNVENVSWPMSVCLGVTFTVLSEYSALTRSEQTHANLARRGVMKHGAADFKW